METKEEDTSVERKILQFPSQHRITQEQLLVVRCHYFKTEDEVKAFLEGIGCPYGEYLELKQRYQAALDKLTEQDRQDQMNMLNDWGFESIIVDHRPKEGGEDVGNKDIPK